MAPAHTLEIQEGPAGLNDSNSRSSGIRINKKWKAFSLALSLGTLAVATIVVVSLTVPGGQTTEVVSSPDQTLKSSMALPVAKKLHEKVEHHSNNHAQLEKLEKVIEEKILHAVEEHKKEIAAEIKAEENSYRGHLQTKDVNGTLICETAECSVAASLISQYMDPSVNPCDDFFMFACGNYLTSHPAPPSHGTFDDAADLLNKRLKLILETPAAASDPAPLFLIRRMYSSCMDTDYMDTLGLEPLWDALTGIGGWPMIDPNWDPNSYSTEASLASIRDLDFSPAVAMSIGADLFNTTRKILYVGMGYTGISTSVLANPDDNPLVMAAYKTYITDSAKELIAYLGTTVTDSVLEQQVDAVIQFETELAQLMYSTEYNNVTDVLDLMDIAELQSIADYPSPGAFDYLTYLRLIFTGTDVLINSDEPVYVDSKDYISAFSTLIGNTAPKTLANYMAWMWTIEMGEETTYRMRNITNNFYSVYYNGYEPSSRDSTCVRLVNYNLGFPTSRAYVDLFFSNEAKQENEILVEDIRASFDANLDVNDWLAPQDVITAKEKLAYIQQFVAYPDWIMNDTQLTAAYEGLEILETEYFENVVRIGQYLEFWECAAFRTEPRPTFLLPPTVLNAFYDPQTNSITILAGILQIPFYQHNSLAALNYGGIGMVIGHELTHGFDNTGRNFDKDGNIALWWSQESIDAFNERAECFVNQYDSYYPPEVTNPDIHLDGQNTLGENIADNGGLREAFQAYQLYVARNGVEPRLPGLDEFTPEQLFYLGNANVWCESKTGEAVVSQILTDPHSPGRYRILGPMSNDVEFSRVWNCPAGSAMNRGNESCLLY